MLAMLFSDNRGKFWNIDCHLPLICFLYIDLQPSSAAPRVQHSGPSNGGLLWKTKVLHNSRHCFHCIHVLFASSCASDSGPHFYSFFFLGGGGRGGGRQRRCIMRDAQMANELRSTNRRQSSNILQRNILQQLTNSCKLRRDKGPNLDPSSLTFAVIRSLALHF